MPVEFGEGNWFADGILLGKNCEPKVYCETCNPYADTWVGIDLAQKNDFAQIKPMTLNPNAEASFEIDGDIDWMHQHMLYSTPNKITMSNSVSAMIQSRWHKNPRIRKKWLKRYGMKEDTVKVEFDVNQIEVCGGSFSCETNTMRYVLRPDQKRRGIALEF